MLVLSRKPQERIQIGDNVFVTVLKVKGNTVSLGIEAPQNVRIVRSELPRFDSEEKSGGSDAEKTQVREDPSSPKGVYVNHCQESASADMRKLQSPRAQAPLYIARHAPITSDLSGPVRPR